MDLAIQFLGIYPKESKSGYNKGTCTPIFIAELFTTGKLWKQPRLPKIVQEWIKKMWYLYTMEFYSGIKKNEILFYAGKWVELENFIFSEVSQVHKGKDHIFPLIFGILTQYQ
jgi:hypothetical protein